MQELKAAREAKGLSLADIYERTGMDRSGCPSWKTSLTKTRRSTPSYATPKSSANGCRFRLSIRSNREAREPEQTKRLCDPVSHQELTPPLFPWAYLMEVNSGCLYDA